MKSWSRKGQAAKVLERSFAKKVDKINELRQLMQQKTEEAKYHHN